MSHLLARFDVAYPTFRLLVNLHVPAQGITAVFGPSGCGKTTLLRCLAGLERSASGFIRLGETIWQDESQGLFLPLSRRSLGYIFQEPRLFPHFTVHSNLTYALKRTPAEDQQLSFDQVVEILDLGSLLNRRPHSLSGGEQQRVAMGRAILTSPHLLLMDEPLSSLDMARKREILPFIQRLDAELHIPIIYVSHSLHEVLQLAETVVLLKEGRVAGAGPLSEVFSQLDLRNAIGPSQIGAVIDTTVTSHDAEFGLTTLQFPGGLLSVPSQDHQTGDQVRVHILSRDVSIVTSPPTFQSSVLNILVATVMEIGTVDPAHPFVDIKLDIGCPLLATITRKSLSTLALHSGQHVYAQIKAVALNQEMVE